MGQRFILWHYWSTLPMGREGSTQSQLLDLHGPEQNENVEGLAQKARKRCLFFSLSFSLCHGLCVCVHVYVAHAYTCVCMCMRVFVIYLVSHSLWHKHTHRTATDDHSCLVPAASHPTPGHMAWVICMYPALIPTQLVPMAPAMGREWHSTGSGEGRGRKQEERAEYE